jgi:hypothetical protein
MEDSKKPLPSSLGRLPGFRVTSTPAFSRRDSERKDIAFGVKSVEDLQKRLKSGFASTDKEPRKE